MLDTVLTGALWQRWIDPQPGLAPAYDAVGDMARLWSGRPYAVGSVPRAAFRVEWGAPCPRQVTIRRVFWDPAAGGSEAEVWRSVEMLTGAPSLRCAFLRALGRLAPRD